MSLLKRLFGVSKTHSVREVCSFCANDTRRARFIIAGPDVFICDDCVDVCNHVLLTRRDERFRSISTDQAGVFVVMFQHEALHLTPAERIALVPMLEQVAGWMKCTLLGIRYTHDADRFDMLQATFQCDDLARGFGTVEAFQDQAQRIWAALRNQARRDEPAVTAARQTLVAAADTFAAALDTANMQSIARNENSAPPGDIGPPEQ